MDIIDADMEKIICRYSSKSLNVGMYKYIIVNINGSCMQKPLKTFFCSGL